MAKLNFKESSLNTTIEVSQDGTRLGYIKQVSVRYHGRKWQWQPIGAEKGPYLESSDAVIASVVLSNCEIKPKETIAKQSTNTPAGLQRSDYNGDKMLYSYREATVDSMKYGIWEVVYQSSQTGYSVTVVNLTKDALEVEYLRLQIANLKKKP